MRQTAYSPFAHLSQYTLFAAQSFALPCVHLLLGPLKYQENLKTKVVQYFFRGGGGANKVYYGRVQMTNSSMLTKIRKIIEKRYLLQQGAQKL